MENVTSLLGTPNKLAKHYTRFRVSDRYLLTGHSHQAWPDSALNGQLEAFSDASALVDEKWDKAYEKANRVRTGYAKIMDDESGEYTLGANTHELLVRFLSALPLTKRPKLITTTGEFHSIRRQLDRLEESGIEVVRVNHIPEDTLTERLAKEVDNRTAAVFVSKVLFENSRIIHDLNALLTTCQRSGAELLIDAYHAVNVIPFSVKDEGLESAFIVGGGYKYCQLGEGNAFLRWPKGCTLRPVITGWFAEFSQLASASKKGSVYYGDGPERFAGSTYDPTSHYRAAAVLDFFHDENLTPETLRSISQYQLALLANKFDSLDLDPSIITRDTETRLEEFGGFLALATNRSQDIFTKLLERKVLTDTRGNYLRIGPAPYLSDTQLEDCMVILSEVIDS